VHANRERGRRRWTLDATSGGFTLPVAVPKTAWNTHFRMVTMATSSQTHRLGLRCPREGRRSLVLGPLHVTSAGPGPYRRALGERKAADGELRLRERGLTS